MPPPQVKLNDATVLALLSDTKWYTPGQIADDLRQRGPLGYEGPDPDGQYKWFQWQFPKEQYRTVYNMLKRLKNAGTLDTALGDDKGREVPVYRILTDANRIT